VSESIRTPLGKVRGLGSAKAGVGHFILQRMTAIAQVFLVPWFLLSALLVAPGGYEAVIDWAGKPWNATLILLAFASVTSHMRAGMQTVIEDYIHRTSTKLALLILNTFFCVILFAAAAFSVLKIAG
jgi:succinate dehydrogenase / fumarate reductase, membrane anchor subunit